jgi:hypothetical protein
VGLIEQEIRTSATGDLYIQDSSGRVVRLYRFREALALAALTAATYYGWVKSGAVKDTVLRDQGRWRVFTESEVRELVRVATEKQAATGAQSVRAHEQVQNETPVPWREMT